MYSIHKIPRSIAKIFLGNYHYLGKKPFRSSYIYCMTNEECDLFGVCVFHLVSAPETCVGAFGLQRTEQQGIWELGRLAMHPSMNGGNHTSWFVSRAIKQLCKDTKVRAIISYADSSAGHIGSIYRACNAFYCGMSTSKKDFYIDGKIKERGKTKGVVGEWRPRPQKHRYVWMFDETLNLKWPIVSCNEMGIPKWMRKKMKTKTIMKGEL
jgi:hypothetical protein